MEVAIIPFACESPKCFILKMLLLIDYTIIIICIYFYYQLLVYIKDDIYFIYLSN